MWQLQNYRTRKETKQLNGYFFQEAGFVGWVGVAVGAGVGAAASAGSVWAAADGSDDFSSF